MERTEYTVKIKLDSYIADPYWPETDDLINIQKKSGTNRAKSEAKRELALKSYLKQEGISPEEYTALVTKASRKWYTNDDGKVIVPRHHLAGMLVNAVCAAPAAVRGKFDRDSFRHYVRIGDFVTDRTGKDTVFDRYVKSDATNQRRRTISEVIEDVEAAGTVELHNKFKIKDLENILTFGLSETGVGACRKMGYGRGVILSLTEG
jgi:hypothetical protein